MPLHPRVLFLLPVLLSAPHELHAQQVQTLVLGLEGGYTTQSTGDAFGTFFDDYAEGLAAQIETPFDGLARLSGVHGGGRFLSGGRALGVAVGLGGARLRARDEVRFTDGGRRTLHLTVGDFNADTEVGMIRGLRGLAGLTVRKTTLRSERTAADGTGDGAEGPGLSGTYEGYAVNGHVGASLHLFVVGPGRHVFSGLRLAATYPVLQTNLTGGRDLTYMDPNVNERTFPDRYGAQGTPADARAVRSNMAGPTVSLSLTLGVGTLVFW